MTRRYDLAPIGEGFTGTRRTLERMAKIARTASSSTEVENSARDVIGAARTPAAVARAIRVFIARRIIFQPDPLTRELLRYPAGMLDDVRQDGQAFGDCDDVAMLAAALGMAAGMRARFVVLAFSPSGPYEHVYTELEGGGKWFELDTTRPVQYPADYLAARRDTFNL